MDSPNPEPPLPNRVAKKGSKIRANICDPIPTPSSEISIRTIGPSVCAWTAMRPPPFPSNPCTTAFCTRLVMTMPGGPASMPEDIHRRATAEQKTPAEGVRGSAQIAKVHQGQHACPGKPRDHHARTDIVTAQRVNDRQKKRYAQHHQALISQQRSCVAVCFKTAWCFCRDPLETTGEELFVLGWLHFKAWAAAVPAS